MIFARTKPIFLISAVAVAVSTLGGCSTLPFMQKERTSIITPGMRMAAVREIGPRAKKADSAEQQRICEQLALHIQTEPDPLVRQEIQNTVAQFSSPMALKMLLAGLSDENLDVRLTCCYRFGRTERRGGDRPIAQDFGNGRGNSTRDWRPSVRWGKSSRAKPWRRWPLPSMTATRPSSMPAFKP